VTTLTAQEEGTLLLREIEGHFPAVIQAREAILEMRDGGSRHWRQMEWIGFYPEFWFQETLARRLDCGGGPTFGNVTFDLARDFVWDQKSHVSNNSWAPLNDAEAIQNCITEHNGVGFLVISGEAVYDEDGSFREWHVDLCGGESDYSRRNRDRGAPRRRRKKEFIPNRFLAFRFESTDELQRARSDGWVKGFQEGMRNSDGSPRRAKVMVNLDQIPDQSIINDLRR
ncbi:uncharacterized protein METZ01_LOCUS411314, partial [marine metagenome]